MDEKKFFICQVIDIPSSSSKLMIIIWSWNIYSIQFISSCMNSFPLEIVKVGNYATREKSSTKTLKVRILPLYKESELF